jgi:hypothetical protein
MHRLAELAELNQLDSEGNLVPLSDLPDADRRVIAVAANSILDRAFGKPKPAVEEPKDDWDARLASMSSEERLAEVTRLLADLERLARLRQSLGPRGREARKLSVLGGQVGKGEGKETEK